MGERTDGYMVFASRRCLGMEGIFLALLLVPRLALLQAPVNKGGNKPEQLSRDSFKEYCAEAKGVKFRVILALVE